VHVGAVPVTQAMMSGLPLGKRYRAMVNAATWPLTYRECTRAHSHVHSRERIKCRELKTRARVKANLYESFLMTPACAQARRTEERPRARLIASYRLTIKRTCFGPASLFLWLLGASENLSISIFASAFAPSSSPPPPTRVARAKDQPAHPDPVRGASSEDQGFFPLDDDRRNR